MPEKEAIYTPSQEATTSNKLIRKDLYRLRSRVARWETHCIDAIRQFSDHGQSTYAHLTDPELWLQRELHYLLGVPFLLNKKESSGYFYDTKQGKFAWATMTLEYKDPSKPKEVYSKGMVEIGIDPDEQIIYHMMFNANKKVSDLREKIVDKAPLDYNKKIEDSQKVKDHVIVYTPPAESPYGSKTLFIHPKGTTKNLINGYH